MEHIKKYEDVFESSRSQKHKEIINAQNAIQGKMRNVHTICIMSPQNPLGKKTGNRENRHLKKNFEMTLKNGFYAFHKVLGKYGNYEASYFIYNISLEEAKQLNLEYVQDSFIFITNNNGELVFYAYKYRDGGHPFYELTAECKDSITNMNSENDFFTVIGRKFKFNIPFPGNAFESVMLFLDKYNEVLEQYGEGYEEALLEAMDDAFTGKAKYFRRMSIYGRK